VIVAVVLVALGSIGSIVAATRIADSASRQSKDSATDATAQIASTLSLSIQHEDDLVASLQEFFLANPEASESQFLRWTSDIRAIQRYPELEGFGNVVLVTASQLLR
jgi:hypothetical protein